jgi:hypothetical protein
MSMTMNRFLLLRTFVEDVDTRALRRDRRGSFFFFIEKRSSLCIPSRARIGILDRQSPVSAPWRAATGLAGRISTGREWWSLWTVD